MKVAPWSEAGVVLVNLSTALDARIRDLLPKRHWAVAVLPGRPLRVVAVRLSEMVDRHGPWVVTVPPRAFRQVTTSVGCVPALCVRPWLAPWVR